MKKKEYLKNRSLAFIDQNMGISSDQIPMEFVENWMIEDFDGVMTGQVKLSKESYEFEIFMFALSNFKHAAGISNFTVKAEKLFDLFFTFQLILASRQISELTDLHIEGTKIFDFDNYENIKLHFTNKRNLN